MKRKLATLILTAVLAMNTIACSATAKTSSTTVTNTTTSQTTSQTTSNNSTAIDALDSANLFSKKDKEIEYDEKTSKTIKLNNESVTISEEGTYILSGTITNGQVIVDAPKEAISKVENISYEHYIKMDLPPYSARLFEVVIIG